MNDLLPALTLSLIFYILLGLSLYGWGKALARLLFGKTPALPLQTSLIWLGWAGVLFVLQILHLFLPIKATVSAPVFLFGILLIIPQVKFLRSRWQKRKRPGRKWLGILVGLGLLAAWVALRSMLSPESYDSGLYYLSLIRWFNTAPIVPGLGNLHGRLAFNQAFFLYAAALNFYPIFNHGQSLANSFLFLLTLATLIESLLPVLRQPSMLIRSHPYQYLPALLSMPILVRLALSTSGFYSPEPDFTSNLLQLTLFVILVPCVATFINGQRSLDNTPALLVVLATTAITVKLSNLVFAGVILTLLLIYAWVSLRHNLRIITGLFMPAVAVILVWCIRGYILSGVPLFPSTLGFIPFEWAVPKEDIIDTANWIYSWARQPGVHWSLVLGNWNWLSPWWIRMAGYGTVLIYPLALSLLICLITLIMLIIIRKHHIRHRELVICIPLITSLAYWFFTAPEPRFATVILLLLPICATLNLLVFLQDRIPAKIFITIFTILVLLGNFHNIYFVRLNLHELINISISGYHAVMEVPFEEKVTDSGLTVYTPLTGDQCWDTPLPCTPYFNPSLRLISPGNLASGFFIDSSP